MEQAFSLLLFVVSGEILNRETVTPVVQQEACVTPSVAGNQVNS
jgi:hypothetical protein